MTDLPRVSGDLVPESMFIRPRRPDDHREFRRLLPQCTPMFVYADEDGRDWVRWSMPKHVAEQFGWGHMQCSSPDCTAHHPAPGTHSFTFDTAWNETDWFFA